jgi:predicted DNA-binding protein with PD1-like motif
MRSLAFRLRPGQDLRVETVAAARAAGFRAAIVLTCVGSLSRAALRPAGIDRTDVLEGDMEILSFVGTISPDGPHLHLAVADNTGKMTGGHAQDGSIVRTTAEIVLGELEEVVFTRPIDPGTTWDELVVEPR